MADIRSHAFSMFLTAAVFAVLGYYMIGWGHQTTTGPTSQLLMMVVLLKWTLRAGAIVFAVAGSLAALQVRAGAILYSVSAMAACGICLAVTVWEVTTPYYSGPGPLILIVLAAWTGYTGVDALRLLKAAPPQHAPAP